LILIQLKAWILIQRSPHDPPSIQLLPAFRKYISEAQYENQFNKNLLLSTGVIYSSEIGESIYYEDKVVQNQLGLFALFTQLFPGINWKMNVNLRQDLIQNYKVPFTPAIGFEGRIFRFISAKANISHNYRIPTFNDRYWVPGGQENLKPENSWNEEVSLLFDFEFGRIKNQTGLIFTLYNSSVDNWILWVPDGLLWSAQNVQKVWSRGFESELNTSIKISKVQLKLTGGYTLAKSTNEEKFSENDQSYQKQLIYVPEHRYFINGNIIWKRLVFSYNHSYTGDRYVTKDNKEVVPGFSIGNLTASKTIVVKENSLDFSFSIKNIWDSEYQAIQYIPMPGRYYTLSVNFLLNKTKNEEF